MKKFTNIMLWISGIFAVIGVVCLLISHAMGLNKERFQQMVDDGKFQIALGDDNKISFFGGLSGWEIKLTDDDDEVLHDGDENTESVVDLEKKYSKLDLEYGAGLLEIYYDDVEHIQVLQEDVPNFKVYEEDDELCIQGGLGVKDNSDAVLTIILPKQYYFEEAELDIGAAQANIDGLTGTELSITVGAGEANLNHLNAQKVELEVGAGQARVMDLLVEDLEVEVGIGQVEVRIAGAEDSYNYRVECGIGNVKIGDNSYGGLGAEQKVLNPGAKGNIRIDCGIGEAIIVFIEPESTIDGEHHNYKNLHHNKVCY